MATVETIKPDRARELRYRKAAELLGRWLSEDTDYDDRVGALLAEELPSDGLRCGDDDAADPS
jgi:hypothetical protein